MSRGVPLKQWELDMHRNAAAPMVLPRDDFRAGDLALLRYLRFVTRQIRGFSLFDYQVCLPSTQLTPRRSCCSSS